MPIPYRAKHWLWPAAGTAAAGLLWLCLPQDAPRPSAPAQVGPATPAPEATGPDEDLKVLATLPAQFQDPAPLQLAGHWALDAPAPLPRPAPRAEPGPASRPAPDPPPPLDFVIATGAGREAWIGGRGYRAGEVLTGGYLLKHVGADSMVVAGPGGELLHPLKAAAKKTRTRQGARA